MRKIIPFLCCLILLCCLMPQPTKARAIEALEPDRSCSLTLHYSQSNTAFPGINVKIYRVAEAFADGTFELIAPFSAYPVNIHGITSQKEWQDTASALVSFITNDEISATRTQPTDEAGTAVFTQLQTGLYLVAGAVAQNDSGTYIFNDFMVYLPTPQQEGGFLYDAEAKPKCSQFTPSDHYSVLKLWKDAGNEQERPESVTVDILKDGVRQQTVTLSPENNWSYSWTVPDRQGVWTVAERNVPRGYQVTVSANETVFVITNTHSTPTPPQTGHQFPLWLVVSALCISGFSLLLLGMYSMRKQR